MLQASIHRSADQVPELAPPAACKIPGQMFTPYRLVSPVYKEPRKKIYIPPVKPAPAHPDFLDTLGLARRLPLELLPSVLRLLSKKDATTKRRALEDLQTAWVGRAKREDKGECLVHTLQ
ncbi:hypothetical protein C8T65DRAFT_639751 [Cerioporus squamosus]|nr:hypothetical protein C8T65DRAFT_639751 [Cerioporus squamosus]